MSVDVTKIYKYGELHPDTPLWNGNNTEYIYWVHWNWSGTEWYQYSRKPFYVSDNAIIMYNDTKYMKPDGTDVGSNTGDASVSISNVTIYKSSHEIPGYTKNIDVILWKPPLVEFSCDYDYPYVNINISGLDVIENCTKFAIFRSSESTNVVDTGEKIFESTDLTDVKYDDNVPYGETYYYQLICYDANMDIIVESEIQEQVAKVHYKFTNGGLIGSNKLTQTLIDELYLNTSLQGLVTSYNEQQLVTLPDGKYTVKLNGAKGSNGGSNPSGTVPGGKGYSITVDDFIVNGPLYITVGNPGDQLNGTNSASTTKDVTVGGGGATGSMTDSYGPRCCGSGGGASYISTDGTLEGRILIAAGGGSAGWNNFKGGDGGLEVGKSGDGGGTTGGTQSSGGTNSSYSSANGTFGIGGKGQGYSGGGGGGGGGYYGGAGGYGGHNAAAGGSSYTGEYNVVNHGATTDEPCVIFYIDEEPDPTKSPGVKNANAKFDVDTKLMTLTWENPVDSDNFAGVRVVRKLDIASIDENDGDVLLTTNETSVESLVDKLPYDKIFYYTIFTYNPDGEYGGKRTVKVDTKRKNLSFPKIFNQGDALYNIGPTQSQLDTAYKGTTLERDGVISHEGIQEWIVPENAIYTITAQGASGGSQTDSTNPGKGAIISGEIELKKGDRLFLLVGQQGYGRGGDIDAGGGGGSFVVIEDTNSSDILQVGSLSVPVTPLIIAGGGSGEPEDGEGTDASLTEESSGNNKNPDIGHGAKIGNGAGGGGYLSSGKDGPSNAKGGKGFLQGGQGGTGDYGIGGFGGGAGGYDNAGAGGGGYTGGVAYDGNYNNGGGGSFVSERVTNVTKKINTKFETGKITINADDFSVYTYVGQDGEGNIYEYDYLTETWVNTESEFELMTFKYGTPTISYKAVKQLPEGVKLIKGVDEVAEYVDYTTLALPKLNIISQNVDFETNNYIITGSTLIATDEVKVIVSCDGGDTWKIFNGTQWVNYADDFEGMTVEQYNSLTKNMWKLLGYKETNTVRIGLIINATQYDPRIKVKSLEFNTILE